MYYFASLFWCVFLLIDFRFLVKFLLPMAHISTGTTTSRHSHRLFCCYSGAVLFLGLCLALNNPIPDYDLKVCSYLCWKESVKMTKTANLWRCVQMRYRGSVARSDAGLHVWKKVRSKVGISTGGGVHLWIQLCHHLLHELLHALRLSGKRNALMKWSKKNP